MEDNKKNKSAEYEYPTPEKPTKKGPQYVLLLLLAAGLCLILALGMKIALDSREPASSPSNTEPVVSVSMPSEEPSDISSTVSVSEPVSTPEPYYKESVLSEPAPPQKRPMAQRTQTEGNLVAATEGTQYGIFYAPGVDIEVPLYYGDSEDILLKSAVAQSVQSWQVGYDASHLMCSYAPDVIKGIYQFKIGDRFVIETSYGDYVYSITNLGSGTVDPNTGYIVNTSGQALFSLEDTSSTVYLYTDSQNVSGQKYVVKAVLVR